MNEILTQKIRNDFDRIALYDQEGWNHNSHYHKFLLKQLPSYCKNILDIGCGTGAFSRLLAQRASRVVAIDLSANMIEVAIANSIKHPNIDFQNADILNWEFPLEQFDAIVLIASNCSSFAVGGFTAQLKSCVETRRQAYTALPAIMQYSFLSFSLSYQSFQL